MSITGRKKITQEGRYGPIKNGDKQVGKHVKRKTKVLENHNVYNQRIIRVV
jgi:hypothetical protein